MTLFRQLTSRRTEMSLLILSALLIAVLLVNLELSQGNAITTEMLWVIGGFIGIFTLAHLALCVLAPQADQVMLPVTSVLNGLGLVMIYRLDLATSAGLVNRQIMWSLVGIALMIAVLVILPDYRVLTRYSYILGLLGLVLLALPLVWPTSINSDARIWISIGPFSLQPGEFSKILLLLFFAQLLMSKRALFTVAGYRFLGMEFPRLRDLAPVLAVWAFAMLIMAGANDFGPALLLFATVLGMVYLATGRTSWLLIGVVLIAIGAVGLYFISDKIQDRVSYFLDPTSGYQLSMGLFGMSFGGITGTGIGQGYPYLVPVAESDYILAAIGEELGFVGLSAILLLFTIFITRGYRIAMQAKDSYGTILAAGLSLTIAVQVFVVGGGITALLPMTGLTTPFMSQGGSSLMANYVLLGLLLRISHIARAPQEDIPAPSPADMHHTGHIQLVQGGNR